MRWAAVWLAAVIVMACAGPAKPERPITPPPIYTADPMTAIAADAVRVHGATVPEAPAEPAAVAVPPAASDGTATAVLSPKQTAAQVAVATALALRDAGQPERARGYARWALTQTPDDAEAQTLYQELAVARAPAPAMETESQPDAPSAPAPSPASWHTVKDWTGTGIRTTETFTVRGQQWRINWSAEPNTALTQGIIQVFVHRETGDLVGLAANTGGGQAGYSEYRGSGRYYLLINTANVLWRVQVLDLY